MTHYWVFLVGLLLAGTCGGYVMGVQGTSVVKVKRAMSGFLVGAVLILGYLVAWVAGAVA